MKINLKIQKGVEWINLAQDRDKWQAYIDTVINFGFNKEWAVT
jgi:hypothetical protein